MAGVETMRYAIGRIEVLRFTIGAWIGTWFADIDIRLENAGIESLFTHRSILTHGCLLPLALFASFRRRRAEGSDGLRELAAGVSLGLAVHLCFDLFPRSWFMHALIHVPFYGWVGPAFSICWIAGSIVACLYIAFRLMAGMARIALTVMALAIAFLLAARSEPLIVVRAGMALIVGCSVALVCLAFGANGNDASD